MKEIRQRILDISYEHKLSHLGSCLSALPIIQEIYRVKGLEDKFILSSGHAGLALYTVLEALGYGNAEEMLERQGIHPDKPNSNGEIDCSTGSLGQGLPIALGMALADRKKDVYCLVSDGECAEGSIWEALRVKDDLQVDNLKVYVNINGYGAYDAIDTDKLETRLKTFCPDIIICRTTVEQEDFLNGLDAHYHTMTEEEYKSL